MNKSLSWLYLPLFLFFFNGCTPHDTMKLNDTIVKANSELRDSSEIFNKKFEDITDRNYSVLETDRKKIVALIDRKLKEVGALHADMPGGESFRDAFVEYYKFERDIYNTEFAEICKLTPADALEQLTDIAIKMKGKTKKEIALEQTIHDEQENFAKRNNLKLK